MTNIIQIDKSRGFTRMDNQLMESLATVDLPARDLRVLMAIARQTIGYQLDTKRLTADEIGKLTNMRRDVTSKSISHLLERRIIYRVGGSRGDIGISPVSEWIFYKEKQDHLNEIKSSHSAQIVSLRHDLSETKTATSLPYTKKEPLLTLPSEEINPPQAELVEPGPEKPARKKPFGLKQMIADNPHAIPEQLLVDWLSLRKTKRAATTQTVWDSLNAEIAKCQSEFDIAPATAMTEALLAGWQGFRAAWIAKRLSDADQKDATQSKHAGFGQRNYRAGLIQREDGTYAF